MLLCWQSFASSTNTVRKHIPQLTSVVLSSGILSRSSMCNSYALPTLSLVISFRSAPMKALAAEIVRKLGKRLRWLAIEVRELTGMSFTTPPVPLNQPEQVTCRWPRQKSLLHRSLLQLQRNGMLWRGNLRVRERSHLWKASTFRYYWVDLTMFRLRASNSSLLMKYTYSMRSVALWSKLSLQERSDKWVAIWFASNADWGYQVESSQSVIRIVGLSATLPNFIDVAEFLRCDLHRHKSWIH